jgi:hypothetical protein
VGPLREASEILQLRASAELALGQVEAAFADVQLILDLADAIRDEPLAVSLEVRAHSLRLCLQPLAEGLAAHQWSEAQLRALQERFQRLDLCADARRVLEAHCAFWASFIEHFRHSSSKLAFLGQFAELVESAQLRDARVCLAAAPAGWSYLEQIRLVSTIRDTLLPAIDATHRRLAPRDVRQAERALEAVCARSEFDSFWRHEFFLCADRYWSWAAAADSAAYAQAGIEAGLLACALERCRLAKGEFPESLEALVPQLVEKLPHDIINGQPLKYHRTDAGQFVLYSVGRNETDDGGTAPKDWVWHSLSPAAN